MYCVRDGDEKKTYETLCLWLLNEFSRARSAHGPALGLSARMILHSSSIQVKIVYVKASLLGVVYPIHPNPLLNHQNLNKFDGKSALKLDFFPVK